MSERVTIQPGDSAIVGTVRVENRTTGPATVTWDGGALIRKDGTVDFDVSSTGVGDVMIHPPESPNA